MIRLIYIYIYIFYFIKYFGIKAQKQLIKRNKIPMLTVAYDYLLFLLYVEHSHTMKTFTRKNKIKVFSLR